MTNHAFVHPTHSFVHAVYSSIPLPTWAPWCWSHFLMHRFAWCSWNLPHIDFHLCPMPGLQGRAACCPQLGHCSWGRRCSSGVHYPWWCWWLGATGTGTHSHRSLYTGSLRHKTHHQSLAFKSWDSSAAVHAGIDKHCGLVMRSMPVQRSAQDFILLHSIYSKFMRHIRVYASRSETSKMPSRMEIW